jgi:hypothetical protein
MRLFFLGSIFFFSLVFGLQRPPVICNNASEPTFGEILHLLSPIEIDRHIFESSQHSPHPSQPLPDIFVYAWQNILFQISKSFYFTKFPLAYLISDGVFTISLDTEARVDFAGDAVLIKEKHWSQRYLCHLVQEPVASSTFSSFCGCWSGISPAQYYGERRAKDYIPNNNEHDWCIHLEPCQGQDQLSSSPGPNECRVVVDPLTASCLASSRFSSPADPLQMNEIASYHLEVRNLKTQRWDEWISSALLACCDAFRHVPGVWAEGAREQCYAIYDYLHIHMLPVVCQWIPVYVVNALIAVAFLSIEDSVASHPLLRLLVAVTVGFFLAIVVAVLVVYRLSFLASIPSYIPLLPLLQAESQGPENGWHSLHRQPHPANTDSAFRRELLLPYIRECSSLPL